MPESVNGMAVAGMGHMEGKTGDHFLFTSESVGEGHPGKELKIFRIFGWLEVILIKK